jgi:hypothetical protein
MRRGSAGRRLRGLSLGLACSQRRPRGRSRSGRCRCTRAPLIWPTATTSRAYDVWPDVTQVFDLDGPRLAALAASPGAVYRGPGDTGPETRDRLDNPRDELRRRFGHAPALVTALEQSHRIGELIRCGGSRSTRQQRGISALAYWRTLRTRSTCSLPLREIASATRSGSAE